MSPSLLLRTVSAVLLLLAPLSARAESDWPKSLDLFSGHGGGGLGLVFFAGQHQESIGVGFGGGGGGGVSHEFNSAFHWDLMGSGTMAMGAYDGMSLSYGATVMVGPRFGEMDSINLRVMGGGALSFLLSETTYDTGFASMFSVGPALRVELFHTMSLPYTGGFVEIRLLPTYSIINIGMIGHRW